MKILMLDDDVVGMEGLKELLKEDGYNVDFAPGPDKARELLKGEDYDLLLLDIMLPYESSFDKWETRDGMTAGVVLLEKLRKGEYGERNKDIRVIVYTAQTTDIELPDRLKAQAVDEDDIFYKPGQATEILSRVKELSVGTKEKR